MTTAQSPNENISHPLGTVFFTRGFAAAGSVKAVCPEK
jgi:hypothetical protein